jgi:hypothetical protein
MIFQGDTILTYSTNPVDFSKFYQLINPQANRPYFLTKGGDRDRLTAEYEEQLRRGQVKPADTIKLGVMMGGQPTDFLYSSMVVIVCVSTKVVEVLTEVHATGWATYPVEITNRKGELLPPYHGLAITGGDCRRDRSRSTLVTRQAVPNGPPFPVYKGLYFHEEDWDGSDFFRVKSFGGEIVTEKVFRAFKKNKISNVKFIPLPDIEIGVHMDKFDRDV